MAQKATGIHLIAGKEPLRKAVVCYVEYERGELYFDHSGRLLRRWERMFPGWEAPSVNGTQVTVVNVEWGWVGEFRPNGASLTLSVDETDRVVLDEEIPRFARAAMGLLAELADQFDLPRYTQLGYRESYQFPAESVEDSSRWVRRLGFAPIPAPVLAVFGPGYHAQDSAVVVFSDDCRYRIAVKSLEVSTRLRYGTADVLIRPSVANRLGKTKNSAFLAKMREERSRQLNPSYFGQLDLEAFLWDGVAIDHEVADFVTRHAGELLPKFRKCLSGTEVKDA